MYKGYIKFGFLLQNNITINILDLFYSLLTYLYPQFLPIEDID